MTAATARMGGALIGALLLMGCAPAGDPEPRASGSCPTPDSGRADIDWTPFVVVGRIQYVALYQPDGVVPDHSVGAVIATVRCRIADVVHDPHFRPGDGDAAYLPVGTELHAVDGVPVTERITARDDGLWRVFRAVETPASAG